MRPRIAQELELLRGAYGKVEHAEVDGNDWFRIDRYTFPSAWTIDGAAAEAAPVLLVANVSYPAGEPYGFWTPSGVAFNGNKPNNVTEVPNAAFEGTWTQFSWAPEGPWRGTADISAGSNLLDWARSFFARLEQGL